MGKFDGVLLVSDFDDTLYSSRLTAADSPDKVESDEGAGPILSPGNQKALEYFMAQGGRFSIATGRSHRTFHRYVGRVPMNAPAILTNGAVIYDFDADRELFRSELRPEIVRDMEALGGAMPSLGFEIQFDHLVCVYRPNETTWRHLRRLGLSHEERPLRDMPQPWTKLVIQDEHDTLEVAQKALLGLWGDHYEAIFSNARLLEVTPKGCTKGSMVRRLAGLLRVDRKNLYCVGDNQNDIPMLAESAVPFAPANCAQVVKDWGAQLLRSCDEDCVAQVVEILDRLY